MKIRLRPVLASAVAALVCFLPAAFADEAIIATYQFPGSDYDGKPLTRAEIENAIDEAFVAASQFDRMRSGTPTGSACAGTRRPVYSSGLETVFEPAGRVGFVTKTSDTYEIQYQNYTRYAGARSSQGSSIKLAFEQEYIADGDSIVVNFRAYTEPRETIAVRVDPSCGFIAPLGTLDEIKADAHNALKTAKPVVVRRKIIEGEFDTPYPAASVLASYERLWTPLQQNTRGYQMFLEDFAVMKRRGDLFLFELNDLYHPIFVSVYPYRDGSKVTYEVAYGYGLSASNSSGFNDQEIALLEAAIKEVALD